MPRQHITQRKIAEHVQRLGELYPPIRLDSVDRTIKNPRLVGAAVRARHRLPGAGRARGRPQRAGAALPAAGRRRHQQDLLRRRLAAAGDPARADPGPAAARSRPPTPAEPHLDVSFKIKILGALASLKPIQDIAKLLYFLTGASTERQAVLAYNRINDGLRGDRRDRHLRDDHHPDQAAGAGALRLLPDVGDGDDPGQGAQALAALPDPGAPGEVLQPGRHQRDEAVQGRHGRRRHRPGHRRGPGRRTPARSAGSRAGCSGRIGKGWSSRPTSSRRSGRASSSTASGWPAGSRRPDVAGSDPVSGEAKAPVERGRRVVLVDREPGRLRSFGRQGPQRPRHQVRAQAAAAPGRQHADLVDP